MDRRQRKTREAIFQSFISLLSHKNYSSISVQDIIDSADIGRTTFYAHFETKDYLLKALCEELFRHLTDGTDFVPCDGIYSSSANEFDAVFLHLLNHLNKNDLNILGLLSSQNNEIFLMYFKDNLKKLVRNLYADNKLLKHSSVPEDFLINHISSSFVEAVRWWVSDNKKLSPEEVNSYFLQVIQPLLNWIIYIFCLFLRAWLW